jgi:hypothetical protein
VGAMQVWPLRARWVCSPRPHLEARNLEAGPDTVSAR